MADPYLKRNLSDIADGRAKVDVPSYLGSIRSSHDLILELFPLLRTLDKYKQTELLSFIRQHSPLFCEVILGLMKLEPSNLTVVQSSQYCADAPGVRSRLLSLLQRPERGTRICALISLGRSSIPWEELESYLRDSDPAVRAATLEIAVERGISFDLEQVYSFFSDPSDAVLLAALSYARARGLDLPEFVQKRIRESRNPEIRLATVNR
ncbi:MAG TPA: hypothetical protein VJ835_03145 [Fimbriimonadaceae bacterium]|nr:hypothetical protein [Fimbriimonadaceae bacterium]